MDEIDDAEIIFIEELTSVECSILFHLGGFLVKGILKAVANCEQCKAAVLGTNSSAHAYLATVKECVHDGKNLHHPSDDLMNMLKSCEEQILQRCRDLEGQSAANKVTYEGSDYILR